MLVLFLCENVAHFERISNHNGSQPGHSQNIHRWLHIGQIFGCFFLIRCRFAPSKYRVFWLHIQTRKHLQILKRSLQWVRPTTAAIKSIKKNQKRMTTGTMTIISRSIKYKMIEMKIIFQKTCTCSNNIISIYLYSHLTSFRI